MIVDFFAEPWLRKRCFESLKAAKNVLASPRIFRGIKSGNFSEAVMLFQLKYDAEALREVFFVRRKKILASDIMLSYIAPGFCFNG